MRKTVIVLVMLIAAGSAFPIFPFSLYGPDFGVGEPIWSPNEGGIGVSLLSGEAVLTATDHLVPGRGIDFAVVRVYRSLTLGYGPLGSGGWHSPLFAHLREFKITGEVLYHDGTGKVWRFLPRSALPSPLPGFADDTLGSYYPPEGIYLRLLKAPGGWRLLDRHNNTIVFNDLGWMTEISDRHRQNATGDEKGNRLRFRYDSFGRLSQIVDDYGRKYSVAYYEDPRPEAEGGDGPRFGLLKRITDFAGRTIEYEFDEHRRLTAVRLPEVSNPTEDYSAYSYTGTSRPTIRYTYNPSENVTDDPGNTTAILHGGFAALRLEGYFAPGGTALRVRLEHDFTTGRVKTVAFPTPDGQNSADACVAWRLEFTPGVGEMLNQVAVIAPWGQRAEHTILTSGQIDSVTMPNVPTIAATAPDPVDGIPAQTLTTSYGYEDDGRLNTIIGPDGGVTSYTYSTFGDRLGNLNITKVRRIGETTADTSFSYGPDRIFNGVVDPEGRSITYPVAFNGSEPAPVGFTAEGVLTTHSFDKYGRLIQSETAGPSPEIAEYHYYPARNGVSEGGLLKSVTARGATYTNHYDEKDILVSRESSFGTSTKYVRDEHGRAVEVTRGQSTGGTLRPVSAKMQRAFDAAGNLVRERRHQTNIGWVETRWGYNQRNQVTSVVQTALAGSDPEANSFVEGATFYSYDTHGRLETTTSPDQVVATQSYDSAGRVATVQTAGSGIHRRGYDELGRLVWTTDGHDGSWRGFFTKNGNMTNQRLASGAFVDREFDLAGGIQRRRVFSDDTMAELLSETQYATTSFGSISTSEQQVSGGGSPATTISTVRTFDGAGRVTEVKTTAGEQERITGFEYQATTGLLAASTNVLGGRTEYFYENGAPWSDRIVTRKPAVQGHPAIVVETHLARDALGREVRRETAGTVTELVFDETGNILSSSMGGANRVETTHDGWGSPVSVKRPAIGGEVRYGYDPDGRLLKTLVTREDGQGEATTYHYDDVGRMDSRTRPGSATELFSYYPDDTLETQTTRLLSQSGQPLVINHQYDQANRLVARTLNREAFGEDESPEGLAELDFGDSFAYDPLGRLLSRGQRTSLDDVDPDTTILYEEYDTRGLARYERTGTRPSLERRYDAFGNTEVVLLPLGEGGGSASRGYRAVFDHGGRMTGASQADSDGQSVPGSDFSAAFGWTGSRSLGVSTANGVGAMLSYGPTNGRLETMGLGSFGALSFAWNEARHLREGRFSSPGSPDIVGGLEWSAVYDQVGRQEKASVGPEGNLGQWTYGYGKADELLFRVEQSAGIESFTSGANGRIEAHTSPQGTTSLRYDDEGRRIEDEDCLYTWDWRGKLVRVDFKGSAPRHAGEQMVFTYDASGRLMNRTRLGIPDPSEERPFIAAKALTWDGQRLAAEAGLNFWGDVLWRNQYLPGPRWLDDAPLVRVETGLNGGTPSTATYNLIRDEMGTTLAVVEQSGGQPPALLARYLGSAYGQTRVELGPELARITFDPTVSELGGDSQEPIEGEGVAGALVINTTLALAASSVDEGLLIHEWSGNDWVVAPRVEFAIGADPSESTALLVLRLPAWPKGKQYRITLTSALTDEFARSLQVPDDHQVMLNIPEDGVTPPRYEQRFEIDRDSSLAAANTLGGAFPGGQPTGFQGAWTDAATGLTYHRNRWYDPGTASWLSKDPMGTADSTNLYAAFGWMPNMSVDPLGTLIFTGERELETIKLVARKLGYESLSESLGLVDGLVTIKKSRIAEWKQAAKSSKSMKFLYQAITDKRVETTLEFGNDPELEKASGALTTPPIIVKRNGQEVWTSTIRMNPSIVAEMRFKFFRYGDWFSMPFDVALIHELGHSYGQMVLKARNTTRLRGFDQPKESNTDPNSVDRENDYRAELGLSLRSGHDVLAVRCPGGDLESYECRKRMWCRENTSAKSWSQACEELFQEHLRKTNPNP